MNSVNLIGRLTRDPDIRYTSEHMCVARYALAVDRGKDKGADFISCVAFDKSGEFAEKYLYKGMKIGVTGRIQTGSYKDKEGRTIYTTDVIVNSHDFCEAKNEDQAPLPRGEEKRNSDFMAIDDDVDDGELPFV